MHHASSLTYRCGRALVVLCLLLLWTGSARPAAQAEAPAVGSPEVAAAPEAPAAEAAEGQDVGQEVLEEAHEESWLQPIGKTVNFALLAGVLIYFVRAPIRHYLSDRGETIRRDLTDAASLRQSAEAQLASVHARLAELPGELSALEARGREELAHERERMKDATAHEREKMLDGTRREIEILQRLAHRQLVEHTADLAVQLARRRIEGSITDEDQARLVEQYTTEVRS